MKAFAIFGLVALISLGIYVGLYERAFPQAAVHVTVMPAEVESQAATYLEGRGYDLSGYKRATVFETDFTSQVFLQRNLGFDGFNQFVKDNEDFAPWWFTSRFFEPLNQNEYYVDTGTDGEILGFDRFLEESEPGARLTKEEAEAVVYAFAKDGVGIDLDDYDKGNYSVNTQLPNRVDHSFEYYARDTKIAWTKDEAKAKGAKALNFHVAGDQISGFSRYVFVPEEFITQQETEDSYGDLYLLIAGIFEVILLGAALVIAFLRFRDRDLRGRQFVLLAAVLAVVNILATATFVSNLYFGYDTTLPWMTFLTETVIILLIFEALLALLLLISASVGESLTREVFPRANDFDRASPLAGSRLWSSFGIGVSFGLAFLAYITLFYAIAPKYFDIWSPVETGFVDFFASPLPFLVVISISLGAAVSEELSFRYLGISLVKKYGKYTFIALLLPAILWAFLHSTYPVYPMYVRGIELTIAGVALGFVFLRYGLFTVIVAHYVIDIIIISTPLLLSGRPYLVISGVVAILSTLALPPLYTFVMKFWKPKPVTVTTAP